MISKKGKTNKKIFFLLVIGSLFFSCQESAKEKGIHGLWLVEKVEMGDNSMTPVSKWVQFNSDATQTSGNGWLQHSYGTWSLNENQLEVNDENGIIDAAGAFHVSLQENNMTWKREEEGQEVLVSLRRIKKLPQSEGNKLTGLWKLTKAIDQGNDITAIVNKQNKAMMHLRWDNVYVQHNMPEGRTFGVYKIHGHKPEIQLVNYGSESQFSFWNFSLEGKKLVLESTDKKSQMEFERIHQFIE